MEEVGFFDQFMEFDIESIDKIKVFSKDIPNLTNIGMELVFLISWLDLTWKLQSTWSWMIWLLLVTSCVL